VVLIISDPERAEIVEIKVGTSRRLDLDFSAPPARDRGGLLSR
jgi:hypothetical protein